MAVPTIIGDLSTTPGLNAPAGGEDVFPQLDNYLRTHAAFIAQLRDALGGSLSPTKYQLACSDLVSDLEVTADAAYFRVQRAMTVAGVRASLLTASSSGAVEVSATVNGSAMFSTPLTIDAGETTSVSAAVPAVLAITELPDDALIRISIDFAGTGAKGLIFSIIGTD